MLLPASTVPRKHSIIVSSIFLFFTFNYIFQYKYACQYKILVATHVIAFEVKDNDIQVIYKKEQHLVVKILANIDWSKITGCKLIISFSEYQVVL